MFRDIAHFPALRGIREVTAAKLTGYQRNRRYHAWIACPLFGGMAVCCNTATMG
jgi:hypothetical protein